MGRIALGKTLRAIIPLLLVLGLAAPAATAQNGLVYKVQQGDTLYRIAVNHRMSVTQLQALNGLEGTVIKVGQVLKVANPMREPAAQTQAGASESEERVESESASPPTSTSQEEAAAADPPQSVQRKGLATPPVSPEEVVTVPAAAAKPASPSVSTEPAAVLTPAGLGDLQVPESQSLYDLAFRLGLPVDSLEALNPDHKAVLADGGTLRVPERYAGSTYTVKAGDTLYGIAADFGIRFSQLMASNPGIGETLRVGSVLKIPAVAGSNLPQLPLVVAEGPVSVYPAQFAGRLMASGVAYDPAAYHIAHPTLPFGTVVLIQNPATGRETFAEVVDRMPVTNDYVIEISEAVAQALETTGGTVHMRIIHAEKQP